MHCNSECQIWNLLKASWVGFVAAQSCSGYENPISAELSITTFSASSVAGSRAVVQQACMEANHSIYPLEMSCAQVRLFQMRRYVHLQSPRIVDSSLEVPDVLSYRTRSSRRLDRLQHEHGAVRITLRAMMVVKIFGMYQNCHLCLLFFSYRRKRRLYRTRCPYKCVWSFLPALTPGNDDPSPTLDCSLSFGCPAGVSPRRLLSLDLLM